MPPACSRHEQQRVLEEDEAETSGMLDASGMLHANIKLAGDGQ